MRDAVQVGVHVCVLAHSGTRTVCAPSVRMCVSTHVAISGPALRPLRSHSAGVSTRAAPATQHAGVCAGHRFHVPAVRFAALAADLLRGNGVVA